MEYFFSHMLVTDYPMVDSSLYLDRSPAAETDSTSQPEETEITETTLSADAQRSNTWIDCLTTMAVFFILLLGSSVFVGYTMATVTDGLVRMTQTATWGNQQNSGLTMPF